MSTQTTPTILITGASRGIGASAARKLAARGAHIIGVARTTSELEALDDVIQHQGNGSMTIVPFDLTELDLVDQLPQQLGERFPVLDGLILNADIGTNLQPINAMDHKIWQKAFDLTVHANLRLLRGCDPLLRKAPAATVLSLTSEYAHQPQPFWGVQAASKAALEALVATYGLEVEGSNISVQIHDPGRVDTAWLKTAFPGKDLANEAASPGRAADTIVTLFFDEAPQNLQQTS